MTDHYDESGGHARYMEGLRTRRPPAETDPKHSAVSKAASTGGTLADAMSLVLLVKQVNEIAARNAGSIFLGVVDDRLVVEIKARIGGAK